MKSGLLWYDADPKKPIWTKIEEAAQRYYEKFGVQPNTCFVNPSALPPKNETDSLATGVVEDVPHSRKAHAPPRHPARLNVSAKTTILPNHIWLGVSESK